MIYELGETTQLSVGKAFDLPAETRIRYRAGIERVLGRW